MKKYVRLPIIVGAVGFLLPMLYLLKPDSSIMFLTPLSNTMIALAMRISACDLGSALTSPFFIVSTSIVNGLIYYMAGIFIKNALDQKKLGLNLGGLFLLLFLSIFGLWYQFGLGIACS